MKTRAISMILTFLLIAGACIPAVSAVPIPPPPSSVPPSPVVVPMGDSPDLTDTDFQKLQISPRHANMELEPGKSDEITVTVTNKDNMTVPVNPIVMDQPYSDYIFDEDWIAITPASTELEPNTEVEFTISVEIPDDAERGQYGLQIVFTDDVMPTPYPSPYPIYINALDLHISVWAPPVMQIQPRYIHDRVESNQDYDYTINLKNTGDKDIEINPTLKQEQWYRYEMGGQAFEDDAITITAPPVVPADGTATVNVHLEVPLGAKGEYYSGIDLGISDSSSDGWYGNDEVVQLNFEVWTQPTEPYVKGFATETASPITIEVESNQYRYDMCGGGSSENDGAEEPSFDVVLRGSTGAEVMLTRTVVEYHGSVGLGGSDCTPPWEVDSHGMYDEGSTSYVERYTADGAVGTWKLSILPHYVEAFEYTVMIGDVSAIG
ncbi:MAG: hypothetical protein C5S48_10245 [Candidatus Methanogaster sp.]|nr:MAG: hypothetical protein C5S48_10245 [ANME-2 cluster archaeon]